MRKKDWYIIPRISSSGLFALYIPQTYTILFLINLEDYKAEKTNKILNSAECNS